VKGKAKFDNTQELQTLQASPGQLNPAKRPAPIKKVSMISFHSRSRSFNKPSAPSELSVSESVRSSRLSVSDGSRDESGSRQGDELQDEVEELGTTKPSPIKRRMTRINVGSSNSLLSYDDKPIPPESIGQHLYKFDKQQDRIRFGLHAIYGTKRENAFFKVKAFVLDKTFVFDKPDWVKTTQT